MWLLLALPAHADLWPAPTLDSITYFSDAVVRGTIVEVRDNTVVLGVTEVVAGEAPATVEAWRSSWRFEVGDEGLFGITPPQDAHPHLQWVGHSPGGSMPVLDRHQNVVPEALWEDYVRGRASWDRLHARPEDDRPVWVAPHDELLTSTFAYGCCLSAVIVPPDPEFLADPTARRY